MAWSTNNKEILFRILFFFLPPGFGTPRRAADLNRDYLFSPGKGLNSWRPDSQFFTASRLCALNDIIGSVFLVGGVARGGAVYGLN